MKGKTWTEFWKARGLGPDDVKAYVVNLDKDLHGAITDSGYWEDRLLSEIVPFEADRGAQLLTKDQVLKIAMDLLAESTIGVAPMNNEKVSFNPLGDPDAVVPQLGKRTPAMEAVDQMFLESAQKALQIVGSTALEFLAENPDASQVEMARRLNRGANAIGLVMAIYTEAIQQCAVREVAKTLLTRRIRQEYVDGWITNEPITPIVRIGGWKYELLRSIRDQHIVEMVQCLFADLAINNPPPDGWKPEPNDDPLITGLFDRFWPVGKQQNRTAPAD